DGKVYIGNGANLATAVTLAGDLTVSNAGNVVFRDIGTPGSYFQAITDANGRVTAGTNPTTLAGFGITDGASNALTNGNIYVGNGANLATAVVPTGDVTMSNTGTFVLATR